jgi:cytochrome c peroxidase
MKKMLLALGVLLSAGTVALPRSQDDAGANSAPPAANSVSFTETELRRISQYSPMPPAPEDATNHVSSNAAAAHLGQFLFFDVRLSSNGQLSCATCHVPDKHFTDGRQLAEGASRGTRHTLGLWNVAHNRWFFLDGRADSLWSQAMQPLESEAELDGDRMHVVHLIAGDAELRRAYEHIFGPLPDVSDAKRFPPHARPLPMNAAHPHHGAWEAMGDEDRRAVTRVFVNVAKCMAAYEQRIVSNNSPFDQFVEGLRTNDLEKQSAISDAAKRGLKLFVGEANCRLCHNGPNFSDGEFHNIGVPPLEGRTPRDAGRLDGLTQLLGSPFRASGEFSDDRTGTRAERLSFMRHDPASWGQFKTPSLRNVALTPPYMHQGQFATLRDVLMYYATLEGSTAMHHQEPFLAALELHQIEDVEAFLRTLSDDSLDDALRTQPASPRAEPADDFR